MNLIYKKRNLNDDIIVFIYEDESNLLKYELLEFTIMNITLETDCDFIVNDDKIETFNFIKKLNYKYVVLIHAGTLIEKQFMKNIHNTEHLLTGKLIDFKSQNDLNHFNNITKNNFILEELHPFIVPQVLIIHTDLLKKYVKSNVILNHISSSENIHHHYTPLWIKKYDGIKKMNFKLPHGDLINTALHSDIIIRNFDYDMRNYIHTFYPEDNTENLLKNIRDWKITHDIHDGQIDIFELLFTYHEQIKNSENVNDPLDSFQKIDDFKCELIISPCHGDMPQHIKKIQGGKLYYYDINFEPDLYFDMILDDLSKFDEIIESHEKIIFNISNIFYCYNNLQYGNIKIFKRYYELILYLKSFNKDIYLFGTDINGNIIQMNIKESHHISNLFGFTQTFNYINGIF